MVWLQAELYILPEYPTATKSSDNRMFGGYHCPRIRRMISDVLSAKPTEMGMVENLQVFIS
jgi:hypothetical protein